MSPELEQVRAEQAEARAESRKLALERGILLSQILEAVRALKPAPFAQPIEKLYVTALEEVERLRSELRGERQQLANLRGSEMQRALERDEARAEVERLQAKVADDALTIGALRDELGKVRAENAELREQCDGHAHVPVKEWSDNAAELKRFRLREELVDNALKQLLEASKSWPEGNPYELAAIAVRDFKLDGSSE